MPQQPSPHDPIPDVSAAYAQLGLLPAFQGALVALLREAARGTPIGMEMLRALHETGSVDWLLGPHTAVHPVLLESARRALLQSRGDERKCLDNIVAFLEGRWKEAGPLARLAGLEPLS